jgi:flavin reductase (DIM6/NTAB) family NADH-FMN oxidoreductase RutF
VAEIVLTYRGEKMTDLKIIKPEEIQDNVFNLIGSEWMLITAGNKESFNTMTASWGGLGVLWNKNVSFIFIRPCRYTYQFIEKADTYTLSFFDKKYKPALNLCGTKSGRDVDKVKETGLSPVATNSGSIYFSEARLVIECRKIYFQDLIPGNFLEPEIEKNYPEKDYHRMYVGEIVSGTCS